MADMTTQDSKFYLPVTISGGGTKTYLLETEGSYLNKDIKIEISTATATPAADNANADVTLYTTDGSNAGVNISSIVGTKATTEPSSGYYLAFTGSGRSKITSAGWIATGNLNSSTSGAKYFPITAATFAVNNNTVYCSAGGYVPTGSTSSVLGTISEGTITPNVTGGTSSGTINRGKQIKIGAGYYASDTYYTAQSNSGTLSITTSHNAQTNISVDGKANVNITGLTVPKDKTFSLIVTADTVLDATSDVTITNNAYRKLVVTNAANGTVALTNSGSTTVTSGANNAGNLTVAAYDTSSSTTLNSQTIVSGGVWSTPSVTAAGTYYGKVVVGNGTITNNVSPLPDGASSSGNITRGSYIKIGAGFYASDSYYRATPTSGTYTVTGTGNSINVEQYTYVKVTAVNASLTGSASAGSATAAISNVNSLSATTTAPSGTAGTDYWQIKATASGTNGSYTPSYTVTTAGWLASTVSGSAQTVTVSGDSTGKSLYIPKAQFSVSENVVYCSSAGYIPEGSSSNGVGTISAGTITNNTTLPSGSTSSGDIPRGKYIKIGAGYYSSDAYYRATPNSGTLSITTSHNAQTNISVDGKVNVNITGLTVPKDKTFTLNATADTVLDATSDITINNAAYRQLKVVNVANGNTELTNSGAATVISGSASAGNLTVSAYDTSSSSSVNSQTIVTNGVWNTPTVNAAGTYYGKVTVSAGTITPNVSPTGTSSGTINRGGQIKISAGYYASDVYYTAQSNSSGTKTITQTDSSSTNISCDGYTNVQVTGIKVSKDKTFIMNVTADTALDTTSDITVNNAAYRKIVLTNAANGTVAATNSGTMTVTSGSTTAGNLTVSAYNSSGTAENNKSIVSGGKWVSTTVSAAGTFYGRVTVNAGTITNNVTPLPSGASSSGDINRGSYIKIGAGFYAADAYYRAKPNSGNKEITSSGSTNVDGYATVSVAAVTFGNAPASGLTINDYVDYSSSAPILSSDGGYLYINAGYTPARRISLARLIPDSIDGVTIATSQWIHPDYGAFDADGNAIAGSMTIYNGAYTVTTS